MKLLSDTPTDIERAARLLKQGQLVAFPTETVYGLGANASDPRAVRRVFEAKGRPTDHPLIVHLRGADELAAWAGMVPDAARRLAEAFWPGPLTLVLPKAQAVPSLVTGGQPTVALRVPDHPVALALLEAFGGGLVAPSANRFGRVSPTTAEHVRQELGDRIGAILDGGPCTVGLESTILDLSGAEPRILRPGMLDAERLGQVLDRTPRFAARGEGPRASGRLASHYAPATPLELVDAESLESRLSAASGRVAALTVGKRNALDAPGDVFRPMPEEPAAYARALYARLRELDVAGLDLILVERPPEEPAWAAIRDRLARAAAGREVYDG